MLLFQPAMIMDTDSCVLGNMKQENIIEKSSLDLKKAELKETAGDPQGLTWTGEIWAKYPVEMDHTVETGEKQDQENQHVWTGQQWNKYV